MHKTLDAELSAKGVNFRAVGQTSDIMHDKQSALQDLAEEDKPNVDSIFAIAGDNERSEYSFLVDLDPNSKNGDDIKITFIDMPGTLYHNGDSDYSAPAKDIYDATMSIVAIHTPALMAGKKKQREINKPSKIYAAFQKASPREESIILFCPVRSEKWVNNGKIKEVYERLKVEYAEILNWAAPRKIRVLASCILTLGHLEFSEFLKQTDDNLYPERYSRKRPLYAPKNCDLPLRVAIMEACFRASSKIEQDKHILDRIYDWTGFPSEKNSMIRVFQEFGKYMNNDRLQDSLVELT